MITSNKITRGFLAVAAPAVAFCLWRIHVNYLDSKKFEDTVRAELRLASPTRSDRVTYTFDATGREIGTPVVERAGKLTFVHYDQNGNVIEPVSLGEKPAGNSDPSSR